MSQEERKELLSRYLAGKCTEDEKHLVLSWYKDITANAQDPEHIDYEAVEKEIWASLNIPESKEVNFKRWVAAAAAVLFLGFGTWYYINKGRQAARYIQTRDYVQDVQPGTNRAILQLADGSIVNLDDAKNGEIASTTGVTITKAGPGKIIYEIKAANSDEPLRYNTITTPRGGQYQVVLPDGTTVYLNAESSLRYPTKFALFNRTVSLTGEAYFTVVKNPQKPFVVQCSGQQIIKVIGTRFNVRQFLNEPIKTTLEEGKVEISVNSNTQRTILKPGDQSIVNSDGIEVKQVDVADAIAWKNGMFVFDNAPLASVLQEIGRWYDVEVDFNSLPEEYFGGQIPRKFTLSQVLETIKETNGVQLLLVEGRKIVAKK